MASLFNFATPVPAEEPSPARSPETTLGPVRAVEEEMIVAAQEEDGGRPVVADGDFERLSVLGVGSFGKVLERTQLERDVLAGLEHAFIVKLHFAYRVPGHVVLVFEYRAGGEVISPLVRRRVLGAKAVAFYVAELALALQCAHDHGVVYRDVKPENCFLDAHLKLGDFGLAKTGVFHATTGAHSICGTPEYMAPDVIARKPSGYGSAVDWWGLGICATSPHGLPPWYTADRRELFDRIRLAPCACRPTCRRTPARPSRAAAPPAPAALRRGRRAGPAPTSSNTSTSTRWPSARGSRLSAPARTSSAAVFNFDATALPAETPPDDAKSPDARGPRAGSTRATTGSSRGPKIGGLHARAVVFVERKRDFERFCQD
ncbi:phosphatase [Aureococcus anophagefferens]|nr:phosphatase [Aureococcus anophagefferens]